MATSVNVSDASQGIAQNALGARIALAAQKGQISSLDRVALGNALTAIKGDFVSSIAGGEARLSPYQMKSRLDSLIDAQIAGGTLSQSQAAQLRGFYSAATPGQQSGDEPGEQPPQAATALPQAVAAPELQPEAQEQNIETASDGDELSAMAQFLNLLRDKLNASRSGYGSAASTYPIRRSPLVVDTLA